MRLDFPELGQDQWVEIRDPKWLSWGEKKKIASYGKDESIDSQMSVMDHIVLALVKDGHITDENGQAIAFPLTEDTINQLPALVAERVVKEFNQANAAAVEKN